MLRNHSDGNPILAFFQFYLETVGIVCYFAILGVAYWPMIVGFRPRLALVVAMAAYILHGLGFMSWTMYPRFPVPGFYWSSLVLIVAAVVSAFVLWSAFDCIDE